MAESASTALVSNGNHEVPHHRGGEAADPSPAMPFLEVPVIDLSCISSESPAERRQEELEKLRSALTSFGCVQLINHGFTSSILDQVHKVGKQFFALPMEEKLKYSKADNKVEGYKMHSVTKSQILDWAERLLLYVHPEDQRKLNLWPQNPETFRGILQEYATNVKSLAETVFKAMAESLNLAQSSFLDQCGEKDLVLAVFNFYPQCPTPDLKLGAKAHTDRSSITLLLQDREVEGLQVMKDDEWFRVPIVPHALLLIIGDQLEIMSNGVFKSPMHKVVTNSERGRMTVAGLCMPELDKEIGPIEELTSEESPRLYKRITSYARIHHKDEAKL